jgi:hypothetical protein
MYISETRWVPASFENWTKICTGDPKTGHLNTIQLLTFLVLVFDWSSNQMAILILNRSTNHKRPFGQNGSN